ncbi:hypothetical protein BDR26DRAFT_867970 [Obelidium mucronatum]|nr:hypothetical protein BDR26DRAFT_867968 [Obelidium mucronatum]KAI9333660.1 hypothetical protein BDR26DRAFT_867970 [Obelidium mucronatum]
MKKGKAASTTNRVVMAVNTTFGYIGATKALHVHLIAETQGATASQTPLVMPRSSPLLFLQSAQPRNLQITDLLTYARVPLRYTEKKPFVFRILGWTHTPFIYFVDRDDYQRKLWYFDSATNSIIPVVVITHDPPLESQQQPQLAENNAENGQQEPAAIVPIDYSLRDPFSHVVDVDDASVNDNVAGFGNIVVWWTWVGRQRPRHNNAQGEPDVDEEIDGEDEEEQEALVPGQPRPPRRYELKVHAYEVTKEKEIEGHGIQAKITTLWTHHLHLTSSQNLSAHMTNDRLHIFHHKKFKPKNDTEIVAKFSFNLTMGGGLLEDETIFETVRGEETSVPESNNKSSKDVEDTAVAPPPPPKQVPLSERQLIGSRANNQRVFSRFHCLEFHPEFDFFKADGTPVGESGGDDEVEMNVTGYAFPSVQCRVFSGRDSSLGNTTGNVKDAADQKKAAEGPILSLVPIVKNIWRPEKRQVSEDGKLLIVAGIEGSRRCLRIVDISAGGAESGLVHAVYLDDEMGTLPSGGRRKKKVGGGVWVIEQNAESKRGWDVVFVECG